MSLKPSFDTLEMLLRREKLKNRVQSIKVLQNLSRNSLSRLLPTSNILYLLKNSPFDPKYARNTTNECIMRKEKAANQIDQNSAITGQKATNDITNSTDIGVKNMIIALSTNEPLGNQLITISSLNNILSAHH